VTATDFARSPAAKSSLPMLPMKCRPASAERDTARQRTVSAAFVSERVTVNVVVEPEVDGSTVNVEARAGRHKATPAMAAVAAKMVRICGFVMLVVL
jgi:hypothetical protein